MKYTAGTSATHNPYPSITHDFSNRRLTRFVIKMHLSQSKTTTINARYGLVAGEVLQPVLHSDVLVLFKSKFSGSDDQTFLLRELENRGKHGNAFKCF
ncbi:hypothetical protein V6N13_075930 [Hibiscus sabdariffa]|uniref:Uncharacterized protein n=1 Tax=Hibiscus sabdariffa TaxID=183260 RepID=A0ABR2UDJ9_9ROSI